MQNDLRYTLIGFTAPAHSGYRVTYKARNGETRRIDWLTFNEALLRAVALRKRGYQAKAETMEMI